MHLEFLIRRLVGIVPILLITWTIVFGAMHMVPGDPVQLLLGGSPASPAAIEAERHRLGLDRPVLVVARHVARNAVIPPLTLLGMQFAVLIGGAVVTEQVFARPGIGAMLVNAVLTKDYPLVQGIVVLTTAAYIAINLFIDLLYGLIDPRISRMSATVAAPREASRWTKLFASPGALAGMVVLLVMVAGAILAPLVVPFDWNETRVCARLAHPSAQNLMGCDLYGRDIFSRVLYGGRYTLSVGIATVTISLMLGGLFGTIIGYAGGRADAFGSRAIDVMLGFPPIILAILVVAVLGVGLWNAALAVGIAGIPRFARVVRGAALSLAAREFIEGAHAIGAGRARAAHFSWRCWR